MTPQELKNSILQLAIQGKLVEQRAEEGTGEQLYREILADKQRLIREGIIKKEKDNLQSFKDDELLFDIPENWIWARFGSIMINRDAERIPLSTAQRETLEKTYNYYGASGIIDKVDRYLFDKKMLLIGEDGANLLARSTPIAFLAQGKYWVNNHAHVLDCNEQFLCMEYVMYYINAISLARYVTGTAQPKMNQEKMNSIPIAVPPLAEQKRIVAKIEELLPYIDRYEQAWRKLEDFNKRFPGDMQKSILQFAIQGKLVEQRPEEGTGYELYHQIQAEKQRLIKAGTIKKEKPLSEITEDEKPFEIPESWKWVRVGALAKLITKGSSPTWQGINYVDRGVLFVTSENVGVERLILENPKYLDERFNDIQQRSILETDDILTNIVGASIGRTAIYDRTEGANINQAVCLIRLIDKDLNSYLVKYLNSFTAFRIMMSDKVDTARANISLTNISDFIIPLPPLAEQKRIVAKLEEILPLCEKLK